MVRVVKAQDFSNSCPWVSKTPPVQVEDIPSQQDSVPSNQAAKEELADENGTNLRYGQ